MLKHHKIYEKPHTYFILWELLAKLFNTLRGCFLGTTGFFYWCLSINCSKISYVHPWFH